jgi:hypothetical protein
MHSLVDLQRYLYRSVVVNVRALVLNIHVHHNLVDY